MPEITVFKPYPFEIGEKIHITEGKRKGDWEVVDCDEVNVRLRCPISGRELTWARFNYFAGKLTQQWPQLE